jgi:hypothetical protein
MTTAKNTMATTGTIRKLCNPLSTRLGNALSESLQGQKSRLPPWLSYIRGGLRLHKFN